MDTLEFEFIVCGRIGEGGRVKGMRETRRTRKE